MSTRYQIIERTLRLVYGEQPNDDSNVTINLVNNWLNDGIAVAAKLNYKDAISVDGIGYVNNSFYTTFKGLTFSQDERLTYTTTLPQIPFGIGRTEGISSFKLKDTNGELSMDAIPLSESQWSYFDSLPPIPNKVLYKPEGQLIYVKSTLLLTVGFTANITMISGGDSTNLNSTLNVPDDYISVIIDYCSTKLRQERLTPKDVTNDGQENV